MGGLTSPKGGQTLNTTSVQQVPAYVQAAQGNTLNAANAILGPYLQQQGFTTAPLNSDQTAAFDLTRQLAQGAFTNPAAANGNKAPTAPTLSTVSGTSYTPTPTIANGYSAASFDPTGYAANTYDPRMATAAQVDGAQIKAFLDPFREDVVDTTLASLNRNTNQAQAQLAARSAAAGSFGGSRQALQSAQLQRSAGEQAASTVATLMSAGFDKATANAFANAQMRQQVELANQGAANAAGQFNAGAKNTADQFTATAKNNSAAANAAAENAARAFGATAYNTAQAADARSADAAALFKAQQDYAAQNQNNANALSAFNGDLNRYSTQAQIDAALRSSDYSRQLQAIQAMLGIGNQQQTYYQGAIDKPLTYLQLMASLTPQNYGGTTIGTQPNTAQSPLQTIAGIGASVLGMPLSTSAGATTLLGSLLK